MFKIGGKKKKFTLSETDLLRIPKNGLLPGNYKQQKHVAFVRMMYGKSPVLGRLYAQFEQCIVDLRSTVASERLGELQRDSLPEDTTANGWY